MYKTGTAGLRHADNYYDAHSSNIDALRAVGARLIGDHDPARFILTACPILLYLAERPSLKCAVICRLHVSPCRGQANQPCTEELAGSVLNSATQLIIGTATNRAQLHVVCLYVFSYLKSFLPCA